MIFDGALLKHLDLIACLRLPRLDLFFNMKSAGIWYLYPKPPANNIAWEIYAYRFCERVELDHSMLWEQYIVPLILDGWVSISTTRRQALKNKLANLPYALPRGRVVEQSNAFTVYWGDDLHPTFGITQRDIEACFGLHGSARWKTDDHEHCQKEDRDTLGAVLGIVPFWEAL